MFRQYLTQIPEAPVRIKYLEAIEKPKIKNELQKLLIAKST